MKQIYSSQVDKKISVILSWTLEPGSLYNKRRLQIELLNKNNLKIL